MFILRFIFYILFNLNLFLFASVLQINDCQQQGKYYNSQLTQCGVCSQNCLSCFDDQNCLFCSQNQYLEFQNSGCSKNCQMGYYQNEYLRECIQCKIRNCSICHDIDSCELCNYGWGLKNKICQNQKCSKKIGTYYDQNTDSCKYYCNQKSDENALECVQNKEVSALNKKTIEIENNVDSNIQQIQIVQLDDQTTVIAVDNQRIIYYQYPDLIPYYQLNFNLTISFAHIIDNYIIAIQQDLKTVLRINFQINVIESFQIGECIQPQAFQHFLFCSDYTFFINQIVELTSPLFSTTTFQPQNRILMNQDKSNIQKSFNQSFKSFQNSSEIQQKNIYASEKINERNLQSQSSKIDSLGCIVQIPSQLDIQPHQIPNILKNSTIAIVQEYLQGQIQQLSFNAFIINQDNEILIFDQNTSYLYKINTQNMTDIQILTQLAGVSKVICAQFFNDVLYLILLDQNDNSIGYFLPSSLKSGRFQFNQSDQIKFQYQQIGSIQKCFLVQQSQVLLLQGEKGILQVKTSQLSISGQSQQQIIFSKYPSGKIKQRFGDIVSIFYIQQTDQISIVYKFGFNIVDLQKKQQNIARFQEFKYDPNPFLQVFIVKTQQYLIIAISLQNNTFNLYLLDEQQEFIGYNFKYNLLSQNQYIQTIQIFANKIFVTSTQNTVILYTIQKNELKFQSSFYYSNFYYLKNENQVFIFSNCQISNALSLTVFDLAKQENINVFFSQSEVISGSTKIYYYDSLQKIVSFSGFRGNNQFKIFDIQQNSFLNISINTTPNQSIQIKNYIIFYLYNSPQSCFIFNLQTLTQTQIKQFLYPTIPYIYSYFLYNDQIYIPISFVNQDCTILYNVDQAQIQQKISSNQNYNIKFIVQQQSQQVVLYDQINTQQIIMNQQLYIKVNITQKEFGFDLQLLPDKIVSNFKQGLYVLNFINKKIDQFTFLQGEDKYIFYWFIYNRQYWIIYYENEVFLLKSQYSDEIKSLGQISYSIYDEKTNILITLSNSQMILNFYLLNNNKTISQTIISQQANPQFQIYQFKDQNLILITIYNSQGYFVNYNKGAVFQFLNGQNQLLFQDGLYVYKDFVITFQYSTLLKFQVVSNKQTISFDLDTFQVVCEFQYKQVIGYIYQQNIKTIVQITSSQVQISNLQSCSFQSQELIGIKFIPSDVLPITYVYYIYLFQASDLLVIASVNGFEVYQFSTMYYQLTYYFNNTLNNAFFVQDTNEIVCYNSDLTFSFFDISTTLFYNQTDLDISSNNNYVWFNDLGIVAQLNQNSGVIDIKDIRTLKMLYQIKLKSMYTIQRYSFFFQEISSHQLIVFVSLTEYHIIDVQTYSYIIYYNSFRCIKQKIFNLNIYCLDDQSQVYILDKLNNSFNSIYKSKNTILNVVDIIILSNEIIQLIYSNNNYTIYQLIIKQESNALDNLNYPFQVIFIDSLLGVQTQSKITIYKISQDNQQNLVVQNIIEIQSNNNIIQSFVINKLDVTYQMIYSTNICGIVYDIQQNQQVGYMQNTAQDLQNGTYLKAKQLINNNNQEDSFLIKIQGCQFSSFSNFFITSIHHTGILKSAYYQENLNNQIFNYQINLSSIILSNYIFDKSYEIIYLEGKIININRIEIQNCQFATNVIFFNPEQTGSIVNSVFNQVKLQQGSLLSITGGQIVILNNSYTNITSKVTSVIYSNQITTLNITKSYFIDNSCNSLEILQPCQGGSVNFKQIEQITLIETQFINSFSLDYGGAIYISNQNNYQVEFIKCIFSNCRAQKNSGGAIYFSSSQNITILGSKFSNNTALLERGGAIALYYSNLLQLENSIFLNNRAQIGGGIWYGPYNQSFLNFETQLKTNLFAQNQGFFYGQDIGSNPRKIARVSSQYSQIYDNNIYNISSGNILEQEVYFTFFDEQNRPLNFLDFQKYPQSLEIYNEECSYSLKLDFEKNKNIQIKQGQTLERSNQLGLFQLLISASYKDKNTQQVSISSTPLNNQQQLEYKLILNFRNCTRGELLLQSQNGFIECSQCQEGKYSLITPSQLNKNSLICNSCPNEANQCYKDTIILKDGYWRQSVETDQIYTCKSQGCSETQKNTRNRCIEGYVGPLCDSCDGSKQIWNEQYGKRGEYCLKCKQLGYQYVYFAAILIFYVIYIVYCVGNLIEKKIIITKLILFRKIDLLITSKSNIQGESLTLWIKVFVHYLQICTLIFSFDIQYPKFLSFSLNVFGDPVNLTITSLDCLTQVLNIYPIWLHRLVTQLANIIIQYIFVSLIYYILHLRDSFNKEYKKRFFKISLKTSFVFFYLFYQPSITKLIFSAVFCKQIGDKYYLISDLNQQCYTKTHLIHLIAIIVPLCIFWCLFIPLLLYRKLGQIKNKVNLMKTISQIIVYGVIYQGYKITCFNWEIIKIYQKLTLMILINSNLNDVIKLTVIIIVILLYTIYLTIKKPHQSKNLMNCEKMLMVILNFNFLFSFLIVKESKPTNIQLILGYIFIIFCNILAFISFIFLSSNYFVINLDDEDTLSNKIKKNFYQLCKKFPAILKYIHFRRNNVYRIHKLWKKLIEFAKQHKNLNSISSQNRNRIKKQLPISSKISLQQSQISLQTNQRNNLDQDQQFLFSSGLIEEKEKSVSTKIYDTYYRGGQIITQKDIQFNTFNKLQQK
ncbi:hypothetical protein ABPG74_016899 [Tetrahymena malaccensis]